MASKPRWLVDMTLVKERKSKRGPHPRATFETWPVECNGEPQQVTAAAVRLARSKGYASITVHTVTRIK